MRLNRFEAQTESVMTAQPLEVSDPTPSQPHPRKKVVRRTSPDRSQRIRLGFQLVFIAINVWIGVQFYAWVRFYESGGSTRFVARPSGVEGWLPIAALMNLKVLVLTGSVPKVHPAGTFLLIAFLAMSLLLKKAFCSWLCPVGTVSEWLWKLGQRIFRRNFAIPVWLDIPLRGLKYLFFGFFGWAVIHMGVEEIRSFMVAPYGLIADVKLLNFFRFIGTTGAIVIAVIAALSILVKNFWCRYLCPYGALLGIVALLSPVRIRRNADACIDCAKCAKACPSRLPVDVLPQIRSAECTLCMQCTAVCPVKDALDVKVTKSRAVPAWAIAAAIAFIFLATVVTARATGHWHSVVPDAVYRMLVPATSDLAHP